MAVVRLGGRLRAGEVRVVSHGSRLGLFRQKCLQACVAGLIERKRHLSSRSVACWNDDRSGCCGTLRERRNFTVVQSALRLHGLFVWVYESASREALVRGDLRGRWALGAAGGVSAGAVVWMKREQHLVELVALEGECRELRQARDGRRDGALCLFSLYCFSCSFEFRILSSSSR